jgi:hypothetical protein
MQDEDRQTQEAFEDYSSMSSIPEESIDRTPLSAEQRRDLLRDSAKFVAEMTPIVGDAMSAREVWEELQKEEPNYLLVGALAGATAVGLIPGIGDAAAQAIRTGARKGLDFARRVEVDPNALGSTGGNIRLRPEDQPTPKTSLNITPPAPLNSLEELLDYNNQVRQPRGMIDRDLVRPNDNILYRPDRGYRAIGPEGYQDFLESGIIRAVADNKKKLYETPYFMRGQSSSAYLRRQGEDYIVEAPLDTSWRGAGYSGDKYVGPSGNQAITRGSPIRVFRRNDDGTFEVVFDNIGDTALLPSQFNRGGLVDEDRQTQEAFDATTGQAMALTPPRVEDQALVPRSEAGQGVEPLEFARPSFESAVERFMSAGQTDINPDDPALFNAYRRSIDYLGDMALGGLDLTDAAFKAAVGIVAQALPEDQERRFARDMVSMPEAFMGYSPGRIQAATDRVAEGVSEAGRRLNQPGPMPTLGSNLGNLAARAEEPTRTSGRVTNPLLINRSLESNPGVEINPDLTFVASFYSPLRSAVEQMPIAREGSTGRTIMSYLQKRAPNLNSSELDFSRLNLDPEKRYTRDEVLSAISFDTDNVLATLTEVRPRRSALTSDVQTSQSSRFSKEQTQNVTDKQEAYIEITLDPDRLPKELVPGFTTHHGETTLAHTRGSINTDADGQYILVWELQSDPLQNLGRVYNQNDNTGYGGPDSFRGIWLDERLRDLRDGSFGRETQATPNEGLLRDVIDKSFSPNLDMQGLREFYKDKYDIQVSGNSPEGLHRSAIRQTTQDIDQNFEDYLDELFDELEPEVVRYRQGETTLTQTEVPFSTNTQYVKNLIVSLAARAKMDGIDRIVIPPIEEIARQRVGTGSFATMADAVKALRPTYVDAVRKSINILNNDTQGQIRLGSQELTYPDLTEAEGVRKTRGLLLDISDFDFNPQTQAVRFAEGGVVSMEEQMSLFDMGGLTDDGAMRDPVSGNEVPPGSMASEVRDDVPAMLSEGEYIVPADVVRYYGVKFFEDLRGQAKSGMMDMEQNGRIGGEPVGAPQDDLTPEELQMLAEITGMAVGGDVRRPTEKMMSVGEALANMSIYEAINSPGIIWTPSGHQATTPEMKRELFRSMGLIQIAEESGDQTTRAFQEGGVVDQPFTPIPNYNIPGFSLFQPVQAAAPTPTPVVPQTESVTLYGPNGEIVTLTLPTDQQRYNALIGQGYSTTQKVQQAPATGGDSGDSSSQASSSVPTAPGLGGDAQRDFKPLKAEEYNALLNDPLKFGADALKGKDFSRELGGLGSFLGPAGGLLLGAVGAGMTAQNIAQARAASQIAKAKGLDTTALDAQIDTYISNLPRISQAASSNLLSSGDAMAERFFQTARDMGLPVATYGKNPLTRDFFAKGAAGDEAFKKEMEATAPPGMTYNPVTETYVKDDTPTGEVLGGTRIDTGDQGTPIYTPSPSTPRPVQRPPTRPDGTPVPPPATTTPAPSTPPPSDDRDDDRDSGTDTNVGNWGGDRDGDGVPNWRDFDDGVGWADKNKMAKGGLVSRRKKPVAKKK